MPLSEVNEYKNSFSFHMAELTGGKFCYTYFYKCSYCSQWCGSASFVGVNGLIKRMTLDRILPNYF